MPTITQRKSHAGNSIGGMVPDGWHLRSEAAVLVGKSFDTLRRWDRDGIYKPSGQMKVGRLTCHLYSDADIEAMRNIANTLKPGPAPHAA